MPEWVSQVALIVAGLAGSVLSAVLILRKYLFDWIATLSLRSRRELDAAEARNMQLEQLLRDQLEELNTHRSLLRAIALLPSAAREELRAGERSDVVATREVDELIAGIRLSQEEFLRSRLSQYDAATQAQLELFQRRGLDLIEAVKQTTADVRRERAQLAVSAEQARVNLALPDDPPQAYQSVEVVYATDRELAAPDEYYSWERGELRFGICEVSIPASHRVGMIERPRRWRFQFWERRDKHFVLTNLQELPRDGLVELLRKHIAESPRRHALVFVHGFNVAFVEGIYRTAQLAHDLAFEGPVALYSWPSKGGAHPLDYTHDENAVDYAAPHLRGFLRLLAEDTGAETVHVLAHSMGNRVLVEAMRDMGEPPPGSCTFHEVMLTAPDIDARVFARDIVPAITPRARRVTLYASSQDRALKISKSVHGYPRAGESGENLVVAAGIETIDVSRLDTDFLGHSYYGESKSVVSDIYYLLRHGYPPDQRFGLRRREKGGIPYWEFAP